MTVESMKYPSPAGDITLVTVTNSRGASVTLSSLGAGIVAVRVPDRNGNIDNVALSYADPADYLADGPCLGKIPGRYANRIAAGHLEVDGKTYQLAINNGPNHLHGGPQGFQNKIWNVELLANGVIFSLRSPAGDENYPGNLDVTAEYRWSDDDKLSLSLHAEADAPTVANLTNHTYWNLDGADAGCALDHILQIKAHLWLPTDDTLIPTGEYADVAGTPMDFTEPKSVGRDIKEDFSALNYGKGYDNCWVLDRDVTEETESDGSTLRIQHAMVRDAVILRSEKSGREVHIDTDQPGVQVYSGNWLDGSPANNSGQSYHDYDGIAIEAQGLPDAPNKPDFPSQAVTPENPYERHITFRFMA